MKIQTGLTGLAVSAAVFLALSTPMREAAPTALAMPTGVESRGTINASKEVLNEPRAWAMEAASDSLAIREAHSDGGYWYWLEPQPSTGATVVARGN